MTNATYWKYVNIFTANRNKNYLFDEWLESHYKCQVGTEIWDWGQEDFYDLKTGECLSDARIMQIYVKAKMPYFKDLGHVNQWLDSSCETLEEFFCSKGVKLCLQ